MIKQCKPGLENAGH